MTSRSPDRPPRVAAARRWPQQHLVRVAVLLALAAAASAVHSADETFEQFRRGIDSITQAAAALKAGDRKEATRLLASMQASADMLQATAKDYHRQAKNAADLCDEQVVRIEGEIARAYQQKQVTKVQVEKTHQDLVADDAKVAALREQMRPVEAGLGALEAEAAGRRWCNEHWYRGFLDQCLKYGLADIFARRYVHLNEQYRDLMLQYNSQQQVLINLHRDEARLLNEMNILNDEIQGMESRRRVLELENRSARAMAADLLTIGDFWAQADALVGARVADPTRRLQDLLPMLDQDSRESLFDDSDRRSVRKLRDQMLDFARKVDRQPDFLSSQTTCSSTAPVSTSRQADGDRAPHSVEGTRSSP